MPDSLVARSDVPFFDVSDPAFSVQSDPVRAARAAGWYARTNYGIAVLRYDEVAQLLKHPALRQGSVAWPAHHGVSSGPFAEWWASWVLNVEGEEHRRLRRLLNPAFSARVINPLQSRFAALAEELVAGFPEPGRCEFMADFAEPYAARVIAILLGLPEADWRGIARESAEVGLAMGVRIRAELPRIEVALAGLFRRVDAAIADRRCRPREDFVNQLVAAQGEGGLTEAELRDALVLLVFGGFDTTRNQLGLAMHTFLDQPEQWRLLAERPELARAAVDEVMRVSPTVTWVTREALADFSFQGLQIPRGTTLHLLTESAGTDPAAVPDARFDITAARPPHFGFGGGVHYCLGHFLARSDLAEALAVLSRRVREPRLGGQALFLPTSGNTGPVELPLSFLPG